MPRLPRAQYKRLSKEEKDERKRRSNKDSSARHRRKAMQRIKALELQVEERFQKARNEGSSTVRNSRSQNPWFGAPCGLGDFYTRLTQTIIDHGNSIAVSVQSGKNDDTLSELSEDFIRNIPHDLLYFRTLAGETILGYKSRQETSNIGDETDDGAWKPRDLLSWDVTSLAELEVWYSKLTDALATHGGAIIVTVSPEVKDPKQEHYGPGISHTNLRFFNMKWQRAKASEEADIEPHDGKEMESATTSIAAASREVIDAYAASRHDASAWLYSNAEDHR